MPSDHRLHPLSVFFEFIAQLRAFIIPAILVLVGASSRGGDWEPWMVLFILPNAIVAVLRYISFRYRYEANELVIHSGVIFRKERHIPYARIQNLDAVQRLLHRLLNVVEVRVETGGGQTPEATMTVLPVEALQEMRARVFAERQAVEPGTPEPEGMPPPPPLLALDTRELLLSGFIENRGAVVMAAAFGLAWELGLVDWGMGSAVGGEAGGRGVLRDLVRGAMGSAVVSTERIVLTVAAFAAILLLIRVLSMGWAVVRLHGFRLTLAGEDLRSEYGLLTRVAATIPLRRIQILTIREGPLHRWFARVAVRADTAGGRRQQESGRSDREWLAPLLDRRAVAGFVRQLIGGPDLGDVSWHGVAPGAFRREVKGWLALVLALQAGLAAILGPWALVALPGLVLWAIVGARRTIAHLGWAVAGDTVVFREGWLWRRVSIVHFAKIQTVTQVTTPFDRRTRMARVRVDTAGASAAGRVDIPYLPRDVADRLHAHLAEHAARERFTW